MPAAKRSIRILHLEDNPRDAELILRQLEAAGFECDVVRAGDRAAYESALAGGAFDLVLCDFNVPGYDALLALKRARELRPDLPFVVISGELSEEQAVECLRAGATDYLLKQRLQRLAPAVVRALDEAVERKRRHQAEIARRESEDRFRSVVAAMAEGVVVRDRDGKIVASNAAASRILGLTEEELRSCRSTDRRRCPIREDGSPFPGAEHPATVTLRTGRPQSQVVMGVHLDDGAVRWVSHNTEPLKHAGEETPYAVVSTLTDITERKQAAEIQAHLAAIVENSPDAIISRGLDDTILTWNTGAEKLFGYRAAEMLGRKKGFTLVPEEGRAEAQRNREHLNAGNALTEYETVRVAWDGRRIHVSVSAAPIRDADGNITRIAAIYRDISERKRAEHALRDYASNMQQLSHRLVEVEEEERRNINRELHDRIGQDLAAVKLNIELIRAMLAEDARRVVGARLDDVQRLAQTTIDNTRNIMAELRPPGLDDYGLAVALKAHADTVAQRLGIPVRLSGEDPKPRLPSPVETGFYRIVQEALNNIAKYARANNVEIALAAGTAATTLAIVDDGVGFDIGKVAANSYGLRIMRERAEAVGARLAVDSAPGRGTRIVVSLERTA
jgi:two-component system sensor histidine kinase UhpB